MSRNYMQCPECGKRALRIATRCPQCGHEFVSATPVESRPPVESKNRLAVPAVVATALIALGIGVGWWVRRTPVERAATSALIVPDTTSVADSAMTADSTAPTPQERRFARTWTNVRTGRSTSADLAAVLLPGDTVLVDSLQRGWWRVTFEDSVLGYVHQSTLQTEPPAPGPLRP